MSITCTRCDGTGFLNFPYDCDDLPSMTAKDLRAWLIDRPGFNDVTVCDCCGDGEEWYGSPGEHYTGDDPMGNDGPYAYNGGLCECH